MIITIEKLVRDMDLKILVKGEVGKEISLSNISRPGLQFAEYYDYFGYERLQVLGMAEWSFLDNMKLQLRHIKKINQSTYLSFCPFAHFINHVHPYIYLYARISVINKLNKITAQFDYFIFLMCLRRERLEKFFLIFHV